MEVPSTLPELLFFVALVIPGVTYSWAKRRLVGWQAPNQDAGSRVIEALFVSAVVMLGYGIVLFVATGWMLDEAVSQLRAASRQWHGAIAWLLVGVLLVGLPALAAFVINARWAKVRMEDGTVRRRQVHRAKETPRGWDKAAFTAYTPRFVRIRTADGTWVGGWFDSNSLVSTYPHEKDLFIEVQWQMSSSGDFIAPIPSSLGVWVPVTSDCIVEWCAAQENVE